MPALPPPPIHMQPGSPAFIEWIRMLQAYAESLAGRSNFRYASQVYPNSYCCLGYGETKLGDLTVGVEPGEIVIISAYMGANQEKSNVGDAYQFKFEIKKDGDAIFTTYGGSGFSGWYGFDTHVHKVIYDVCTESALVNYTSHVTLTGKIGPDPTLDGAGMFLEIR